MIPIVPSHPTFKDLCLLLQAGSIEQALALLETTLLRPAERCYVQAWAAVQQERWEELASCLLEAGGLFIDEYRLKTERMTIRRRRSWLYWLLGNLAMLVERYEDAFGWYTRCVQHLSERRMNDPLLRVRALCGRGATLLRMHAPQAALVEYEQAMRLGQKHSGNDQLELCTGLCNVYIALGDLEQGLVYGHQALEMVANPHEECALRGVLGNLYAQQGNRPAAQVCYLEALGRARQCKPPDDTQIVTILLGLADLQRQEGNLIEARTSYEQAIAHRRCAPGVRGKLFLACAALAQAEQLREEALRWYTAAAQAFSEAGADAELAEAHSELARLYETAGDLEQAAFHWKAAYQAQCPERGEQDAGPSFLQQ